MKQKASEMLKKAQQHIRGSQSLSIDQEGAVARGEVWLSRSIPAVEAIEAERDGLLALLKQTATAFQENNRSLTANQANAWQAIEQALRGEQKGVG
jgi:hypothetical protein